jgi:hypothetical protein
LGKQSGSRGGRTLRIKPCFLLLLNYRPTVRAFLDQILVRQSACFFLQTSIKLKHLNFAERPFVHR